MATDREIARAQWLDQVKVIRRNERRLGKAFPAVYEAAIARWMLSGAVVVPIEAQRDLGAVLVRLWREAIMTGSAFPVEQEKSAFAMLETKAEAETLFEQIMQAFLDRFGGLKIAQIIATTREQIMRAAERGVRDGLSVEEIAAGMRQAVPALSRTRAHVIARTEVHTAAMFASQEVAKTAASPLNKRWVSVFDHRTRDFGEADGIVDEFNHRVMNEVTVGPDELFAVPGKNGVAELMAGPGDPNGSAANTINCFPADALILGAGLKGGIRRHYSGQMVKLSLGGPINLAVTPNHPVLTDAGWVAARDIVKGDNLVHCGFGNDWETGAGPQIDDGYSTAEKLYNAGQGLSFVGGAAGEIMDFHGEMVTEQVDIVSFNSRLRDGFKTLGDQLFGKLGFTHADVIPGELLARSMIGLGWGVPAYHAGGIMGSSRAGQSIGRVSHSGMPQVPLGNIEASDANLVKNSANTGSGQVKSLGDAVGGVSGAEHLSNGDVIGLANSLPSGGDVTFKALECTAVEAFHYDGPVYNFESDTGLLVSNGIINHNCRCALVYRRVGRPWPKDGE